jgi:2-keto-3-deoxy-L-fuconate dehydrogenase
VVESSAARPLAEFGPLDVMGSCIGCVHQGTVLDCTEKDWNCPFNPNVKSTHHMIKTFVPGMLEKKAGQSLIV